MPKLQDKDNSGLSQSHVCGTCESTFDTEEGYLTHLCTTGFSPADIEHQDALTDGNFSKIAEAALSRGEKRADEDEHPAKKAERLAKKSK